MVAAAWPGRPGRCGTASCRRRSPSSAMAAASYPVNRSSISKTVPARPPRFIEPMTTLSSSAPSSSRSSMMSAVPSTPSTPGRDRASDIRSSRSARSAMAIGRSPARSAPRAGWSAAMMKSRLSVAEQRGPAPARGAPPRRWPAGGAPATSRMALIWSRTVASAWSSCQKLVDLGLPSAWRPSRRAATPRWPRRRWRSASPARCPSPRAARGTARRRTRRRRRGRSRRRPAPAAPRPARARSCARTPLGPCLTTASFDAEVVQRARPLSGSRSPTAVSHSSRLPTATVTCGRACCDPAPGLLAGRPEHRAVVEVEDGDVLSGRGLEGGQGGAAARLLRTGR